MTTNVHGRAARWAVELAPFAVALVAYLVAFAAMQPDATGDEPHYLLAAQSVAFDGDLDLTNDYASRERTLRATTSFPLSPVPHAADYRDSGQLRPIRGIGMSTLLAPAVALGGLVGARILMILIAALLADQLFRLLRDLGVGRRWAALSWVAVALCYPLLLFSSQIYPELPGALIVVAALRVMVTRASSPAALALASAAAAGLVWLHVRFIPIAAGVLLGLVVAACRAADPGSTSERRGLARRAWGEVARCGRVLATRWRSVTLPVVVPFVAGLALFAAVAYHLYGTAEPTAPYAAFSDTTAGTGGWDFLYEFALADLLNPVHGWIPYVPVHWLGLAALGCLLLRWGWAAAACLAVAVGHEILLASAGPVVGWGFPARYLIIVVPLVALPVALAIQDVRWSRFVFAPLLAVSLGLAAAAVHQHLYLLPVGDTPRLFGARTAADLYPRTNPSPLPTSYVQEPGETARSTGTVRGRFVVAEPPDEQGYVLLGPYLALEQGNYRATFRFAVTGARPDEAVAGIDVTSSPPTTQLVGRTVTADELLPGGRLTDLTLDFSNPKGGLIETRLYYTGIGAMRAGPIRVEALEVRGAQAAGRLPDWPKALAWMLGTIAAGWLLVRSTTRAQRGGRKGTGAASTTN
jgi:hypothetical protein